MTTDTSTLTTPPNKGSNVVPAERTYKSIIHKPPVEIDDVLYFVINGSVYKATVCLIQWTQYRSHIVREIRGEVSPFHTVSVRWDEWNKNVFRKESDAIARARAMRSGSKEQISFTV